MMKHLKYLKYVLTHKWWVLVGCWELGVPLLGLLHDLSKFGWAEWPAYAENFFGDKKKGYTNARSTSTIHRDTEKPSAFTLAWHHHRSVNKHHWGYWVNFHRDLSLYAMPMPDKYVREMVADWWGAGKAQGKDDLWDYWMKEGGSMLLHPETRYRVRRYIIKLAGCYYDKYGEFEPVINPYDWREQKDTVEKNTVS